MASTNSLNIGRVSGLTRLDRLIAGVDKLVSLPEIYYRLEAAIESPCSTAADFDRLLSSDTDLCARLLRMANSAFYCFPTTIETTERAIRMIGLRQIRELVLATSVIKMFERLPLDGVNMNSFWEHSVAVGVLTKSIARYAGLPQADRYYIPGLLHDIGRLVLYLKLPGLMSDLLKQHASREVNLFQLERAQLSYDHAEIGGRLLELWKVPESIYEGVYFHHRPMQAMENIHIACAIHVADVWVNKYQVGSSGERYVPLVNTRATTLLGLNQIDLEAIWSVAREEISDVIKKFLNH